MGKQSLPKMKYKLDTRKMEGTSNSLMIKEGHLEQRDIAYYQLIKQDTTEFDQRFWETYTLTILWANDKLLCLSGRQYISKVLSSYTPFTSHSSNKNFTLGDR